MPTRKATAVWEGGFRDGSGTFKGESATISGNYTAGSRFQEDPGTNPEELLAAAHAACFNMALSVQLERNGTPPTRIQTDAACTVEKVGEGFGITKMKLNCRATVPNIDDAKFQELAKAAKDGCPVSQVLKIPSIELDASLV